MKPVRLLCYMFLWTWKCSTFKRIPIILIVLTNKNVALIYSVTICQQKTKDCALSRYFQHKLRHCCFYHWCLPLFITNNYGCLKRCASVFSNRFVIYTTLINFWISDMQILREIVKKAKIVREDLFWQFSSWEEIKKKIITRARRENNEMKRSKCGGLRCYRISLLCK